MRVIAGTAKGHKLKAHEGKDTRPTTDRVKESMFNIIQGYVSGSIVLDLFAGTGALTIEALSRGAQRAVLVENALSAQKIIIENLTHTKLIHKANLESKDALSFLQSTEHKFDLIFLDPPYGTGLIEKSLKIIKEKVLLPPSGVVVTETEFENECGSFEGFSLIKQSKYGKIFVSVYQLT